MPGLTAVVIGFAAVGGAVARSARDAPVRHRLLLAAVSALIAAAWLPVLLSGPRAIRPASYLASAVALAIAAALPARRLPGWGRQARVRPLLRAWTLPALAGALAMLVAFAHFVWNAPPPAGEDALAYHLPRVEHWIAEGTLGAGVPHDARQSAFPDVYERLLLPVLLFAAPEQLLVAANLLPWALIALSAYTIVRDSRLPAHAAAGAAAAAAAAPLLHRHLVAVKNDLWLAAFVMAGYACGLAAWRTRRRGTSAARWLAAAAGAALATAPGIKATGLLFAAPAFAVASGLLPVASMRGLASVALASGAVAACLGPGPVTARNLARYGHPLGPPHLRAPHVAAMGPRESWTRMLRLAYRWTDVPGALAGRWWETGSAQVLRFVGMQEKLPGEGPPWPGTFAFARPGRALTTTGLTWIAVLALAWDARRRALRPRLVGALALACAGILTSLAGCVVVRWQAGYIRFFLPALALTFPAAAVFFAPWRRAAVPWCMSIAVALLYLNGARRLVAPVSSPEPERIRDFRALVEEVPPGSRVASVLGHADPEMLLFRKLGPRGVRSVSPPELPARVGSGWATHVLACVRCVQTGGPRPQVVEMAALSAGPGASPGLQLARPGRWWLLFRVVRSGRILPALP